MPPTAAPLPAAGNWSLLSTVQLAASLPAQLSPAHTPDLCHNPDPTAFLEHFSSFLYASTDPFRTRGGSAALPLRSWFACLRTLPSGSTKHGAAELRSHCRDVLVNRVSRCQIRKQKLSFLSWRRGRICICRAARQFFASSQAASLLPSNCPKPTKQQKEDMVRVSGKSVFAHIYF